jgi:hypothetical protein
LVKYCAVLDFREIQSENNQVQLFDMGTVQKITNFHVSFICENPSFYVSNLEKNVYLELSLEEEQGKLVNIKSCFNENCTSETLSQVQSKYFVLSLEINIVYLQTYNFRTSNSRWSTMTLQVTRGQDKIKLRVGNEDSPKR